MKCIHSGGLILGTVDTIKMLAKEKGLSITFLCSKLGVAKVYFNDLKKHNREIPKEKLQVIADLLNTTPEYLLGKTEQKEKPAGITDELWSALCKDDIKMDLAIQISQMSPEKAKRVLALLQAAQMLPPEESNPTDTE